MEGFIRPNAKRHNLSTKDYIEQNKAEILKFLKSKKSEHKTNKVGAENLIHKLDNKCELYIYNGNKKYKCTKVELLEYLSKLQQAITDLGYFFINFKYVQLYGFVTVVFILPDLRILQAKIDKK